MRNLHDYQDSRKPRREVVVALIECEGETVLVKNIEGLRRDWQLPGSRVEDGVAPLTAMSRILLSETGLNIPANRLKLVKSVPRETNVAQQIVYCYRVALPAGGLNNLPSTSPDGHHVRRVPLRTLRQLLNEADNKLIAAFS